MRYRRAASIVLNTVKDEIQCYNFIQQQGKILTDNDLATIRKMDEWIDESYFLSTFDSLTISDIAKKIHALVELGIIIREGSKADKDDTDYRQNWKWGSYAGLYHFSVKNVPFVSGKKIEQKVQEIKLKVQTDPSPVTFHRNTNVYSKIYTEEKPNFDTGIFQVMKRRRTIRSFDINIAITKQELMTVLFAGLGIVGFREAYPTGLLPLKMTPSGGARNPYDAYVLCQNVKGLDSGIYHYSPYEHSLGLVNDKNLPKPEDMLGSQPWLNDAPAIILLVANLKRTMWKYEHYNAYRVMLIEAGHIGQNMILAANQQNFYGSPTAAVCDKIIEESFKMNTNLFQSCIYAIAIGHIGANKDVFAQ